MDLLVGLKEKRVVQDKPVVNSVRWSGSREATTSRSRGERERQTVKESEKEKMEIDLCTVCSG
jgi:hypothetical protein